MKLGSHGRRFATRSAAVLLGATALVSCAKSRIDKTSLEVRVTSDLAVPGALDKIVVHVQTTPTRSNYYPFSPLVVHQGVGGYMLPLSLAFTPNGDPKLPFEVDVTGMLGTSEVIFRAFTISGFFSGQSRVLNVSLTAACVGKHCAEGQSCADPCGFQTISPTVLPTETDVGRNDAGAGAGGHDDAAGAGQSGHDGGAPDAGGGGGAAGTGGNGGATGGATGMAGAAGGAGGAGGGGAGTGVAGDSGTLKCTNNAGSCGDNNQPQVCLAGVWQNKGAACVEPQPLCAEGSCVCVKTRCPTMCADLSTDAHNCGHCGHDCLGGKCWQGQCQGFSLAPTTNQPAFFAVAVDAQNVYWLEADYNAQNSGAVMKVSLAGGAAIKMASTSTFARYIASDGTNVYWGTAAYDTSLGTLFKLGVNSPTGTTPTTVATDQDQVANLVVTGGFAYWTAPFGGTINKVSVNGGTVTPLAVGQAKPMGLTVDASSVYWTTYDGGTVMKVGLNGGTPQTLAANQTTPTYIVVGPPNVYWTAGTVNVSSTLMKIGTGGGTPTPVLKVDGTDGLVADATNLYWFAAGGLRIITLADGFMTTFQAQTPYPEGQVAMDATSFYWTGTSYTPPENMAVWRMAKP